MKIAFYYVDPEYIQYLKAAEMEARGFTTVPNVAYANRNKFMYGTILKVNQTDYYVPISSYKTRQQDNLLIKIEDHGKMVVCGSMRFNYMIPVPKQCLTVLNFKDGCFTEKDRCMLQKEYKACRRMLSQAQKRAQKTYERVLKNNDPELLRNSCMFLLLENKCKSYGK